MAVVVKTEPADPENETTATTTSPPNTPLTLMSLSSSSMTMCCPVQYQPIQSRMLPLDGLHVSLAPYAAKFLMLAIKDRIRHGRHFTFKCENRALTFVSESVSGSVVTKAAPYAVLGYWTQVKETPLSVDNIYFRPVHFLILDFNTRRIGAEND